MDFRPKTRGKLGVTQDGGERSLRDAVALRKIQIVVHCVY